jgi:hypothetical protein
LITWLLQQAEVSPSLAFYGHDLRARFGAKFDRAREERLVTRLALGQLPKELTFAGERVTVLEAPAGGLRAIQAAPPHESVEVGRQDVERWTPGLRAIAEGFRLRNDLGGAYAELHARLLFLGEYGATRPIAAVLALLDSHVRARVLLPALPTMLPARYRKVAVFCPSYEPEPGLRKTLEGAGITIYRLDPDDPFRLDLRTDEAPRFAFTNMGDGWLVKFDGVDAMVANSRGMQHIARLLAQPDVGIPSLSLDAGMPSPGTAVAEDVMDSDAMRSAKARARELQAELTEAEEIGSSERKEHIRDELERLTDQLKRDTGLLGKARRFSDESSRARLNVTRAIERAVKSISAKVPGAADHLTAHIETGHQCRYRSATGIAWDVSEVFHHVS